MKQVLIWMTIALCLSLLPGGLIACGDDDVSDDGLDEAAELEPGGLLGKEDGAGAPGLPVNGSYTSTKVWAVANQWEDTDTANAKLAGLAWGADSGLNWDEKFVAWIASLEKIDALGFGQTFQISTPFGKSLPAPKLDCADVALMLRASFAAWYQLPFYVVAGGGGETIHFGHFGIRTSQGIWNNMPKFARAYKDHSDGMPQEWTGDWPQDKVLRARGIQKGDEQAILDGLRTGAYLDEIHLNKRAGHFIRLLMIFTGSAHLADSRNTFNLVPEALQAGDTLLYRRARRGSGHTMVIVRVEDIGGGQLQAENAFGNIPPSQPSWESAAATKRRFTNNEAGGPTTNSVGEVYAEIGGGIKRWRVAKNVNGRWTNSWMDADESNWINDRDFDRISARPAQFEALLGQVTPERRRDLLLEVIEQKRRHLTNFPASCSAREGREEAFNDLYELMSAEFGVNKTAVDQQYRILADYVFAELDYLRSKTCCWNSTTSRMYEIIMDYNQGLQTDACAEPEVFKAVAGDYAVFLQHAVAMDLESEWVAWSADEECPQAGVLHDTEAEHHWTPLCSLSIDAPEPPAAGCVPDELEDNDTADTAVTIDPGNHSATACSGDSDYYHVVGDGGTLVVTLRFSNDEGDLDLELLDDNGDELDSSAEISDVETVETATEAGATYTVVVFGYRGAEASYTLDVALQ